MAGFSLQRVGYIRSYHFDCPGTTDWLCIKQNPQILIFYVDFFHNAERGWQRAEATTGPTTLTAQRQLIGLLLTHLAPYVMPAQHTSATHDLVAL
jgi:hypothetical protein